MDFWLGRGFKMQTQKIDGWSFWGGGVRTFFFLSLLLSHQTSSMSSADPRRPDKVVPFHMPPVTEDDPPDWNSNIAMVTGKRALFVPY
jgi:hypothetical protein